MKGYIIMRLFLLRLLSLFPSKLPIGMTEFEKWSSEVIELTGPIADTDSLKFALCSMILHKGPDRNGVSPGSMPKNFFVQGLRKSAANQVASQVFQDIKIKQQEEAKRKQEEASKQLELPSVEVLSN
jgi:hypothetical protein